MRSWWMISCCLSFLLIAYLPTPEVNGEVPKGSPKATKPAVPPATNAPNKTTATPKEGKPVELVFPEGEVPDKVATAIMGAPIYRHAVRSVAYSPDGLWLAAGTGDGQIHLWDVKQKKVVRTIKAHVDWTFDLTFTPDGLLVSGGGDNLVKVIDPKTGMIRETFEDHSNDLHGVAVTSDGKWLVTSGDDKHVLIRSLADKKVAELGEHQKQVTSVTLARDDQLAATSSRDGTVKLWDLRQRKLARTLTGHTADVISVAFSPDGKQAVSGGHDQTVRMWSVSDGKEISNLPAHPSWIFAVLYSQNGELVLTGCGDGRLRLFRVSDKTLVFETSLGANVSDLALSRDGKVVAAGTSNGAVWFIELAGEKSKVLPEKVQVPQVKQLPPAKTLEVSEYLKLHRAIALREKGWMEAAAGMTDSGDAFTIFVLNKLDEKALQPDEAQIRQRVIQQIGNRRGDKPGNVHWREMRLMLLRASLSDLYHDPLAAVFVPWLIDNLKAQAAVPVIRKELEALLDKPPVSQEEDELPWDAASKRIKEYIERILAQESKKKGE